jgi:hypothetical protein
MNLIKEPVKWILRQFGLAICAYEEYREFPPDFPEDDEAVIRETKPFSLTSPERIYALRRAIEYIVQNDIPGAIVECGVWRGGSMMVAAKTLLGLGRTDRDLYLFDTFEGMPEPTDVDISVERLRAPEHFREMKRQGVGSEWCCASLEDVRENLYSTGYDRERIHFVKGMVEETVPACAPAEIALLRLDTDFYESTRHELTHLFPLVSRGGVLIVDDYGYWEGAKKAVDEFISANKLCLLLHRIDESARVGVKL